MNNSEVTTKVEKFFSKYPEKTYDSGMVVIFAGDEPPDVISIQSGQIIQYEVSPQGDKVIINSFQSPAFFPMSWAINKTPNAYFYEVQTRAKVRLAPPEDVLKFLVQNPDVALDLLSRVYRGTDGLLRKMAHLMGGSANSRLLYEIIISVKRFGEPTGKNSYVLQTTETDLAARTGISRETASREMRKFIEMKLLEIQRGTLTVPDLRKLEDLIGSAL